MSKDFKLRNVCPHFVIGEFLAINEDRITLNPIKNPSSNQIDLFVSGTRVPKKGVYSDLTISTQRKQPFEIVSGENELEFSVNNGEDQIVTLPTGSSLQASRLADFIRRNSSNLTVETQNGGISLEVDTSINRRKSLFLKGGSAHSALGLADRRFYRNEKVIPGWNFIKDEDQFNEDNKKIVFERALDSVDDIIELSYYTRQEDCRRCKGVGVEQDIRHDQSGDPVFTEDEELLLQEVQKTVFTRKGSNVFFKWYGTSLVDSIGEKVFEGGEAVRSQITSEISNALDRYRQIKVQQSNIQPVSNEEFLLQIRNIRVEQGVDPSVFRVEIDIVNKNNETKRISKKILLNSESEETADLEEDRFRKVLQRGS